MSLKTYRWDIFLSISNIQKEFNILITTNAQIYQDPAPTDVQLNILTVFFNLLL